MRNSNTRTTDQFESFGVSTIGVAREHTAALMAAARVVATRAMKWLAAWVRCSRLYPASAAMLQRLRRPLRSLTLRVALSSALALVLMLQTAVPLFAAAGPRTRAYASKKVTSRRTATPAKSSKRQDLNAQDASVEAAVVRHAPTINARIQGSVRQLLGEDVTLNSNANVTIALLVPGTPQVIVNGNPTFGGTVQGTGSTTPSNYKVTLNGSASLGNLVTRTDPISMPGVDPPPAPTGARDVSLNHPGDSAGDFSTVRDLTINGNFGSVAVPPGTYRNLTANGNANSFVLGISGSTQPSIYNLQRLTLNGGSKLQVAGPITLTVAGDVTLNGGASAGSATNPLWLALNIASGNLTLNGGSKLYGVVHAPNGTVSLNGNSLIHGSSFSDRLTLNGNSVIEGEPGVLDSINPTRANQGQSVTVALHGINTHWVSGQTTASFGGEISVGGAAEGEFGTITVSNSTTATAQINISSLAALAPRAVRVQTPIVGQSEVQQETLPDAFTVVAVTPPGFATSTVSTIAGGAGLPGFADGPAATARFNNPSGIAVGADETIYVADAGNNRIRRVANDGSVSTIAGGGTAGFADGSGASAKFNNPQAVAVDANGVVFVTDTANNRIRRIATDGSVTTLAGDGTAGLVNGAGAQARFSAPSGVALDNAGNIYVADTGNAAVRFISTDGNVSTVAGDGTIGNSDSPNARFDGLVGVAFDGAHAYAYIADTNNHRLRRLDPAANVITLAGSSRGFADSSGAQARFADPTGVAVEASGKLVIADTTNSLVRGVDPNLAQATVTTIAGTGERGLVDGSGNQARFFTPRGIAVAQSSAIIVADSGNQVLRKVLVPPVIDSIVPAQGRPGAAVTIVGERLDAQSASNNTVRFARAGGGETVATVTLATRTQLTVTVPADAATGPVTVQTQAGTSNAVNFEVVLSPIISDFDPKHGTVGSTVSITGTDLTSSSGGTVVTFEGSGGARKQALLTEVTAAEVRAVVPNGAMTGAIQLTTPAGTGSTATAFTVDPGDEDFQVTVAPSTVSVVQHSTATCLAYVTSTLPTFSQLAELSISGLPPGVVATISPQQITSGAHATIILDLSSSSVSAGNYSFTLSGVSLVGGTPATRSASASLNVIAAGQTTLSGRVLSTEEEPVIGATVSLDGRSAATDAAGGFLLAGIGAGVDRPLMIDGRTASAPNRTYPVIAEPATIVAGQANVVPYIFHLPIIDVANEVTIVPNQTTVVTTPRVPGLQVTIPAGANLRNRDGSPVTRVSITPVPIDRTPAPLPNDVAAALVYTIQPGGAISDVAMPVVYPNLNGVDPGTQMTLYRFNHDMVRWEIYGTGHVSADGRVVNPDTDAATGQPYGIRDFSWYFPTPPINAPGGNPADTDCFNRSGDPVDLSSGSKIESMVDISFGGARGGITLGRVYGTDLLFQGIQGRFGFGMKDSYDIRVQGSFEQGGAGRVIMPEQVTGRLFSYVRTDPDGSLVFASTATVSQLGDIVRKLTDGTFIYRTADGTEMRFDTAGRLTSIVDRNGNATTLSYDGSHLVSITDAVGRSVTLEYDSSDRIVMATDPIGRVWRYEYVSDKLEKVTDPLNQQMKYFYSGLLFVIRDKRNNVVKDITYDRATNRVIREDFEEGKFVEYSYTLSGTIVTGARITDSLGRTRLRRFDSKGYTLEATDELGQTSRIERDVTVGLPLSSAGPCGCAEGQKQFDERGNVIATTDRLGQTERMEYEPTFNNVTRTTDKLGRVTTFGYDSHGNLTSITDPLNQTTMLGYDQFGELISITDPLNHTSRMEYDTNGSETATVDALGNRSRIEYDLIGRVTAINDPLARRVSMTYDAMSRVLTMTDPAGATTSFDYDENGNQTRVTDALNHATTMIVSFR